MYENIKTSIRPTKTGLYSEEELKHLYQSLSKKKLNEKDDIHEKIYSLFKELPEDEYIDICYDERYYLTMKFEYPAEEYFNGYVSFEGSFKDILEYNPQQQTLYDNFTRDLIRLIAAVDYEVDIQPAFVLMDVLIENMSEDDSLEAALALKEYYSINEKQVERFWDIVTEEQRAYKKDKKRYLSRLRKSLDNIRLKTEKTDKLIYAIDFMISNIGCFANFSSYIDYDNSGDMTINLFMTHLKHLDNYILTYIEDNQNLTGVYNNMLTKEIEADSMAGFKRELSITKKKFENSVNLLNYL